MNECFFIIHSFSCPVQEMLLSLSRTPYSPLHHHPPFSPLPLARRFPPTGCLGGPHPLPGGPVHQRPWCGICPRLQHLPPPHQHCPGGPPIQPQPQQLLGCWGPRLPCSGGAEYASWARPPRVRSWGNTTTAAPATRNRVSAGHHHPVGV